MRGLKNGKQKETERARALENGMEWKLKNFTLCVQVHRVYVCVCSSLVELFNPIHAVREHQLNDASLIKELSVPVAAHGKL